MSPFSCVNNRTEGGGAKTTKKMTCQTASSRKIVMAIGLKSICSAFLVASSLLGCAITTSPPKSVDRAISEALSSRSPLHIAVYPPSSFEARGEEATPLSGLPPGSSALEGLLSGLISSWGEIKAGERFRKDFELNDPTLHLRDSVAANLQQRLVKSHVRINAAPLDTERPEDLRTRFGDSLLLSFKTTTWFFYPANSGAFSTGNRYGIRYIVRGRLTDTAESRIVWEDECDYVEADADKYGPSFEDLTANDAAILKSMFSKAADYCASGFFEALIGKNQGRQQ